MPRDGATVFSDLIGKLDVLRVKCDQCGRDGCYGLARLIDQRGRDAKLIDWLDELTAECPKKIAHNNERSMWCEAIGNYLRSFRVTNSLHPPYSVEDVLLMLQGSVLKVRSRTETNCRSPQFSVSPASLS